LYYSPEIKQHKVDEAGKLKIKGKAILKQNYMTGKTEAK
jgi:hypothetical protein